MATVAFYNTVGSADIHTVVHFPGGFRTLRRSEESRSRLGVAMLNKPFQMEQFIDLTIAMRDGDAAPRRFRRLDFRLGRRYPDVHHYFLMDEIPNAAL